MAIEEQVETGLLPTKMSAALLGILFVPLIFFSIESFSLGAASDDSRWNASTYIKVAFPLVAGALLSQVSHLVLEVATHNMPAPATVEDIPWSLKSLSTRLNSLSLALLDVTDILMILTLLELSNSILQSLEGGRPKFYLSVRYTAIAIAGAVLYLTLTTYIKGNGLLTKLLSTKNDDKQGQQRFLDSMKDLESWDGALLSLWTIASFAMLLYAVFVHERARAGLRTFAIARGLVCAAVLNLMNPVRAYLLPLLDFGREAPGQAPSWYFFADNVLDFWVRALALGTMYYVSSGLGSMDMNHSRQPIEVGKSF